MCFCIRFCSIICYLFLLQSAKTNLNVEQVFFSIARDIKQRLSETDSKPEVQHFFDKSGAVAFLLHVISVMFLVCRTLLRSNPPGKVRQRQSRNQPAAVPEQPSLRDSDVTAHVIFNILFFVSNSSCALLKLLQLFGFGRMDVKSEQLLAILVESSGLDNDEYT
jgi:hypothetical protein